MTTIKNLVSKIPKKKSLSRNTDHYHCIKLQSKKAKKKQQKLAYIFSLPSLKEVPETFMGNNMTL